MYPNSSFQLCSKVQRLEASRCAESDGTRRFWVKHVIKVGKALDLRAPFISTGHKSITEALWPVLETEISSPCSTLGPQHELSTTKLSIEPLIRADRMQTNNLESCCRCAHFHSLLCFGAVPVRTGRSALDLYDITDQIECRMILLLEATGKSGV